MINSTVRAAKLEDPEKPETPPLHHVIDVSVDEAIELPETMPLESERKLQCKTCHGIEEINDMEFEDVDKNDPEFLNGGPYQPLTEFCTHCHQEKDYQRPNIHVMLDNNGEIKEDSCKFCHEEVLDRDKSYEPDDIKLRIPADRLCYSCHLKTPHLNSMEHQVEPDEDRAKLMKESAQRHNIILPLSRDGKVMCVTCHTPHQPGVIEDHLPAAKQVSDAEVKDGIQYKKDNPWQTIIADDKRDRLQKMLKKSSTKKQAVRIKPEFNYQQIEKEVLLRLPAKDGTLCLACHSFDE
ncbi:MAG: hypothetical protein K0U68_04420 [Gammaproteobacteria bacterium]|nr:hypothetical protein [Gammaproteobacteria bacterium]